MDNKKFEIVETFSNANGDGRVYPDTFKVVEVDNGFQVWDFTGWTGYETCDPFMVAHFDTTGNNYPSRARHAAINCAWTLSLHSDPRQVFNAAIDLIEKRPGSFGELKKSIDWQDCR